MPYITADRIKETTTSIGTGIILLSGAAKGYRAFSSVMTINDTCPYAIVNNNSGEWEVGIATYSALNTLTRTTIHSSSNNNLIIDFKSGSKDVFLGPTAKSLPGYDPATNTIMVNGVTAGTATIDTIKADAVLAKDKNLIIEAGSATGIGDGGSILIRPGAIDTSGSRGRILIDSMHVGIVKTGSNNTVVGQTAFGSAGTGTNNTAIGYGVFQNGPSGSSNTAVGYNVAPNLSGGQFDTFIGANAGHAATNTVSATAVGSYAGYTGSDNSVALGAMSLFEATGAGNIGVGNNAGRSITSGTNNLALGINAGSSDSVSLRLSSGSNNTLIGAGAVTGLGNGAAVNSTVIGANAIGQGSNTTTIGNASTTTTHIAGTIAPLPLGTGGSVTNAVGNGTTVTYTCANTFSVGQVISITGLTITTGAALNLANQTITACTALNFTIANTTVGTATGQSGTVTPVGAGKDVVIKAANGSGVGAGGNIILQPGAQGSSGGDGFVDIQKRAKFYTGSGPADLAWCVNASNTGMWYSATINGFVFSVAGADVFAFRGTTQRMRKSSSIYWANTDAAGAFTTGQPDDVGIYFPSRGVMALTAPMNSVNSQGGSLAFQSFTTAQSANVNDWVMGPSAFQRVNCTTASSITGIAPYTSGVHVDGRMIRIYNVGTANLTLSHNSTASLAANRFFSSTGADIVLSTNKAATLIYDATNNGSGAAGWRVAPLG